MMCIIGGEFTLMSIWSGDMGDDIEVLNSAVGEVGGDPPSDMAELMVSSAVL